MARKKITQKSKNRKDNLDPTKDEFMVKSMSALDWAVERRKHIGVLLLVALVAAVAGIAFNGATESKAAEASALLGTGLEVAVAPVRSGADEDGVPDDNADDDEVWFETAGAKATEMVKRFEEIKAAEGDSQYGRIADLNLAAAHFDNGDIDKAIKAYEGFIAGSDDTTSWLKFNALEGLGQALEAAGKTKDAAAKYKEIADNGKGRVSLMGKYNQARLLELENKDKAAELLGQIMDELRNDGSGDKFDYLFSEARARLLRIDPEADVPDLPGGGMDGLQGMDPALLQQLMQARQNASGGAGL